MARGSMKYSALIRAAQRAKKNAHAPYSKFLVGAAVQTDSGKIYVGCNIENSSFSLTICAERVALFKAVSESHRKFKAIAVTSSGEDFISPCGACRQVIHDLAGNIDVVLTNSRGSKKLLKMNDLLPFPFDSNQLKSLK